MESVWSGDCNAHGAFCLVHTPVPYVAATDCCCPRCRCCSQGANQHLQAGLVNITKLQQLDLEWNTEACSGDLRVTGRIVQKVSEVFGDYSTVLCNQGFISGVHLWLIKVNNLSEPDSIFIGVCRGCMPLDQDPQVHAMHAHTHARGGRHCTVLCCKNSAAVVHRCGLPACV